MQKEEMQRKLESALENYEKLKGFGLCGRCQDRKALSGEFKLFKFQLNRMIAVMMDLFRTAMKSPGVRPMGNDSWRRSGFFNVLFDNGFIRIF